MVQSSLSRIWIELVAVQSFEAVWCCQLISVEQQDFHILKRQKGASIFPFARFGFVEVVFLAERVRWIHESKRTHQGWEKVAPLRAFYLWNYLNINLWIQFVYLELSDAFLFIFQTDGATEPFVKHAKKSSVSGWVATRGNSWCRQCSDNEKITHTHTNSHCFFIEFSRSSPRGLPEKGVNFSKWQTFKHSQSFQK